MIKFICTLIWDTAELFYINLGKLAPYIFGGMIERWPRKVKKEKNDE